MLLSARVPERVTAKALALAASALVALACGARTDVQHDADAGVTIASAAPDGGLRGGCVVSADCKGFEDKCVPVHCDEGTCVREPKIACDDGDPCTADTCE